MFGRRDGIGASYEVWLNHWISLGDDGQSLVTVTPDRLCDSRPNVNTPHAALARM